MQIEITSIEWETEDKELLQTLPQNIKFNLQEEVNLDDQEDVDKVAVCLRNYLQKNYDCKFKNFAWGVNA